MFFGFQWNSALNVHFCDSKHLIFWKEWFITGMRCYEPTWLIIISFISNAITIGLSNRTWLVSIPKSHIWRNFYLTHYSCLTLMSHTTLKSVTPDVHKLTYSWKDKQWYNGSSIMMDEEKITPGLKKRYLKAGVCQLMAPKIYSTEM